MAGRYTEFQPLTIKQPDDGGGVTSTPSGKYSEFQPLSAPSAKTQTEQPTQKKKKGWMGSLMDVPVIGDVAEGGLNALEWAQDELIEPFAASVTAPAHEGIGSIWKPAATLAGAIGGGLVGGPAGAALGASAVGTAIGHQGDTEKSYEEWDAPSVKTGLPVIKQLGVKGAAEVAYPAGLIPLAKGPQWLGKGAEALGMTKTAAGLEKAAQVVSKAENLPGELVGKGAQKVLPGKQGLTGSGKAAKSLAASVDEVHAAASIKQSELDQVVKSIADPLGLESFGAVKSKQSMLDKINRKGGSYGIYSMKDHARATIVLDDNYSQVGQVVDALKAKGAGIENTLTSDAPLNKFGYRGINVTFPMGDGINAEIQLHTKESLRIKAITDNVYRKWRPYEKDRILNIPKKLQPEYQADIDLSNKLWQDYADTLAVERKAAISDLPRGRESVISPSVPSNTAQPLGVMTRAPLPSRIGEVSTTLPSSSLDSESSRFTASMSDPSNRYSTPNMAKGQQNAYQVMGDLQNFDEMVRVNFTPDNATKLAELPGIKQVIGAVNPAALASDPVKQAVIGRQMLRHEGQQKAQGVIAHLNQLGSQEKVFGKLTSEGMIAEGSLKGLTPNTVRTYSSRYAAMMTPEQKAWVDTAQMLEREKLNFLTRNGIEINKLSFEEGGEYAGRRVYGMVNADGELLDTAFVGSGPSKPGAKLSAEKHRTFETAEEAVKAGYRYLPEDEALYFNVMGAYNRVADKKMADWLIERIPWRSTAGPEDVKESIAALRLGLRTDRAALKQAERQLNRLSRSKSRQQDELTRVAQWTKAARDANNKQITAIRAKITQEGAALSPAERDVLSEALTKQNDELGGHLYELQSEIDALKDTLAANPAKDIADMIPASQLTRMDLFNEGGIQYITKPQYRRLVGREPNPISLTKDGKYVKWESALDDLAHDMGLEDMAAAEGQHANEYLRSLITQAVEDKRQVKALEGFARGVDDDIKRVKGLAESIKKPIPEEIKGDLVSDIQIERQIAQMEALLKTQAKYADKLVKAGAKDAQRLKESIYQKAADLEAIAPQWKQAIERARTPSYTEASLHDIPAFAGKILTGADAKQTAQLLRKEFTPQFSQALTAVNKVNSIARYFALAGDMSVGTIQLLFLAGSNPKIYGKAMAGFVKALMDPEYEARYLAKNNELIQSSRNLILTKSGSTEFTEAMAKGGWLHKGPAKVAGKALEPFQRGFESALDTAGIELRKSYDYLCTTPERTAQVEQFINEFRGVTSSARIGVSPTQRQLETVALLAPRYNRAIAGLLFDVSRGNLRGQLARKNLAYGVGAVSALGVAVSIARGETEDEIADHFNPNSANFFTWDVAGQKVGPGTKVRSVVKLFANSISNADDLGKFSSDSWMDNPILKFGRGNSSPAISTGLDILTGKDYLGNSTRDNMLQLTENVVGENLLPLWVQSVALEGGSATDRMISGAGQFGGLRTYPQPLWEVRDGLRDRYSSQAYQGKSWGDLNNAEQDTVLKANPDLVELDRKIKTQGLEKYGSEYERAEYLVKEQKDGEFNATMDSTAQLLASGQMSWRDYNDARSEALTKRSAEKSVLWDMKSILEKESVDAIQKWVQKNQKPEDKAMDAYKAIFYEDLPKDESGLTNWDAVYSEADAFLARQPKDIREYIEQHEHDWVNNLPAAAQQVEKKRLQMVKLMRPYWEIEDGIYEDLANRPGSSNIMAVKDEWDKMKAGLPQQLQAQGIPQQLWSQYIARAKAKYAPRVSLNGRVVYVDDLVSTYKARWKLKPENAEAVQALAIWYAQ